MSTSSNVFAARALAVVTIGYAIAVYWFGASLKPGYSHVTHYLSELNATGTPSASLLSWAGFLPIGLLLAAFLIAARPVAHVRGTSSIGFALLWSQPIAFVGVALAPCDPGCLSGGSVSQLMHDVLGAVTYFLGAFSFIFLAGSPVLKTRMKVIFVAAGVIWFVLFVMMLLPAFTQARGLLQRSSEVILAVILVLVAWRVVRPERVLGPTTTMHATLRDELKE